ncbi:argininosuccinate lyase [endosymbiont 'TC1' of Trimyema compressum]|uniref:argininosuccinate lyase n=1 Tax=endosymbiont 'TC1' of Trimyema compressum TaxID=243899 RepID=UPI0007F064C5|nr:argininosuccinate lyase [endosymbiont 'TC1' of Trimyema compressum]AMP19795.1 argininosuccinate lyase [endosymbiont 'TC1' of Trimyema compressum]
MKLWGGRFSKETDELVEEFHSSITFDKRLYKEDIEGSIAHGTMLVATGIISQEEGEAIVRGLKELLVEIEARTVKFTPGAEDIHMNIETLLTEKIGEPGKKLHTGRSRNDQVATDLKLFAKNEGQEILNLLKGLLDTIITISSGNLDTVMPGYTHLQKAQPITFAHHMMAYFEMFKRDYGRIEDALKRADTSPLGSGALAGTTFPLDREMTKSLLGFKYVSLNSLDGVSDRDYVIEMESACAIIMVHLSRICEEVILWSSDEFQFATLDDAYSTGSSIMPQKKNPDVAELVRGKSGRVFGHLMATLTMLKGLPLAYNKDMQEDKEGFFDTIDTIKKSLLTMTPMLLTMKVNKEVMEKGAAGGFTNATDVADYLAKKGIPFREAHHITGELVAKCLMEKRTLESLSLEEFKEYSTVFDNDIYEAIALLTCVNERKSIGGPAKEQVEKHIAISKKWLLTL